MAAAHRTYSSPRIHVDLREDGLDIGRHRVARLLRDNACKLRSNAVTSRPTDSKHTDLVAVNLLSQNFDCVRRDQKWGIDISYVWTMESWLYVAIVLDFSSRRIVGGAVSNRLQHNLTLNALRQAIA